MTDGSVTDGGGPTAAVFDLDRTLTRRGTWLPFLVFAARRTAPWRLAALPAVFALMAAYKAGLLTRGRLKERMHALLLGPSTPEPAVRTLADAFAEAVVRRGLRPEVRTRLEAERAAGRRLVLATAAHRFYAEPLARRLGVDEVVATEAVWREGRLTPRLAGPNLRGAAKRDALLRQLAAAPAADGFRFFSDDASDLPTFDAAAERVAVHPGARLRRIARERGWPVLDGGAP